MALLSRRQESVTLMVVLLGSLMSLCLLTAAYQPFFSLLASWRLFRCTFTFVIHALLLAGIHLMVWCYQLFSPLYPLITSP